jgi:hypothetical protein
MNKKEKINFRCGDLEADLIRKKAAECGLSTSDYCRQVILGYRPKKRLTDDEMQKLTDVRKLCADMVHITNLFRQGKYMSMMVELADLTQRLKGIVYGV